MTVWSLTTCYKHCRQAQSLWNTHSCVGGNYWVSLRPATSSGRSSRYGCGQLSTVVGDPLYYAQHWQMASAFSRGGLLNVVCSHPRHRFASCFHCAPAGKCAELAARVLGYAAQPVCLSAYEQMSFIVVMGFGIKLRHQQFRRAAQYGCVCSVQMC